MKLSNLLISIAGNRRTSRKRARPSTDAPSRISKRSRPPTDVSLRIAHELLTNQNLNQSNIVFCPLSINVLLSLVASGSGGETLDQLLHFLGSETLDDVNSLASKLISVVSPGDGGPELSFANGVWLDQTISFRHSFKQVAGNFYKATSLKSVDFKNQANEVTKEVNLWVEKETNGLIKEAIPPGKIDDLTRVVLANAFYFKGKWEEPFKPSKTKNRTFNLLNGSKVEVPFMTNYNWQLLHNYDGFQVLKLPYKHGADQRRFSMCFYLPRAKNGLPALIKKLSSEPDFFRRHVPNSEKPMRYFWIPKFKISFGFEAAEVLKSLGLVLPFSAEEADFTNMVDSSTNGEIIHVSEIFHKSVVDVNEEGTEAVAYSGSVVGGCKKMPKYYDFVADHPFLFTIREDTTGVVLFIGSVVDPSAQID